MAKTEHSFSIAGNSSNWDASWISDSSPKPRSSSSPSGYPQSTGQEPKKNQHQQRTRERGGRGGRGGRGRGGRGERKGDPSYQRSVSDSKYAAKSPHFQDNKVFHERTTASEGGVPSSSRTSDGFYKKRAPRGKTRGTDSGGATGETNSSGSLTSSEGESSGSGSVQNSENGAWCTVTHRKHSLKADSQDSRGNDPRTFDDPRVSGSFDRRTGRLEWGDRGRGHRGRGDRGRGNRGRGNFNRAERGSGNRGRGDPRGRRTGGDW